MSELNNVSNSNKRSVFYNRFYKQKNNKQGLQRKYHYIYNNFDYTSIHNFRAHVNWRKRLLGHKRSNSNKKRTASLFSGTEKYNLKEIQDSSEMIKKRFLTPESDVANSSSVNTEGPVEVDKKSESESEKSSVKIDEKTIYSVEEIHQKIITQITKLSNSKKINVICANASGSIHKQKMLELSKALKDMCSNQNVENREAINSIIPDIGIKLEDLPIDVIRQLIKTLNLHFIENEIYLKDNVDFSIKEEILDDEEMSQSDSDIICQVNLKQESNNLNSEMIIKIDDTNQARTEPNSNPPQSFNDLLNSLQPLNNLEEFSVDNIKQEVSSDMDSFHFLNNAEPASTSHGQTVSLKLQTKHPSLKTVDSHAACNQNHFEIDHSNVKNLDDAIKTMMLIDKEILRLMKLKQSILTDLQQKQNSCNNTSSTTVVENLQNNVNKVVEKDTKVSFRAANPENIPEKILGIKFAVCPQLDSQFMQCPSSEDPEMGQSSTNNLLPTKTQGVYDAAYRKFKKWCRERTITIYSENVLLTYFSELADKIKMKSSSMWSHYSMIKSLLNTKDGVDISKYLKLRAFLKKQNEGFCSKNSRVLTHQQFQKFLTEASDEIYLGIKIILVIGISGACRCDELVKMTVDDIQDYGSLLHIKIDSSKTNKPRSFTIAGEDFLNIYRKYVSLRPPNMNERRFFLKFQNGRCYRMVMGIHKIGSVVREVASYLKLPNWKEYTGHSLRTTSVRLMKEPILAKKLRNPAM